MDTNYDKALATLKDYLKELKLLQQKNSTILNFLPQELKTAVKSAFEQIKAMPVVGEPSSSGTAESSGSLAEEELLQQDSILGKDKCALMRERWQKDIIDAFTAEATAMLGSVATDKIIATLQNLSKAYYDKYSTKKWFDPQDSIKSNNYLDYIGAFGINRTITLQRRLARDANDMLIIIDSVPTEQGPLLSGSIKNSSSGFVGINQVAEIEIPAASGNKLILGGNFSYVLDSLDIPDTFCISDQSGKVLTRINNNVGKHEESGMFGDISGNLLVDVTESSNSSEWEVTIKIYFIQISFRVPECHKDLPCPKW